MLSKEGGLYAKMFFMMNVLCQSKVIPQRIDQLVVHMSITNVRVKHCLTIPWTRLESDEYAHLCTDVVSWTRLESDEYVHLYTDVVSWTRLESDEYVHLYTDVV